jgi:hypothetical protein
MRRGSGAETTGLWRSVQVTAETKTAAGRRVMAALERELRSSGSGEYSSTTTFAVVAEEWFESIEDLVGGCPEFRGTSVAAR